MKALIAAGYQPVFASPNGTQPVVEEVSDGAFWYEGNVSAFQKSRTQSRKLGLCGVPGSLVGNLVTRKLSEVNRAGLNGYAAEFFPGGHAPMENLWQDAEVGNTLRYSHHALGKAGRGGGR